MSVVPPSTYESTLMCTAWYFSHLPVRDTNALWMHAHEHYRVVIPLDVAPEKAAEWLQ